MPADETIQELTAMFFNYSQRLEQKINHIEGLYEKLKNRWDTETFSELYHAIHSLNGSSGIYGYQKINQEVVQLELKFKEISGESQFLLEKENIQQGIKLVKQSWTNTTTEEALQNFIKKNTNVEK